MHPRHASRPSSALSIALPIGVAVAALGALWSLVEVPTAAEPLQPPMPVAALAVPPVPQSGVEAADPCADARVIDALDAGDDAAVIEAFGGAAVFREAVAIGNAPCIRLDDPDRIWVVVNKARPLDDRFTPDGLRRTTLPAIRATTLQARAADALEEMADAATDAGAGTIGINNGYRSYRTQQVTYAGHVGDRGETAADRVSARPGHSEHQTGLAFDAVSCNPGCGDFHVFGDTGVGRWTAEHAWEHGWIVRYEHDQTAVTGYSPEPWHLRYIGVDLAAEYHHGGYRTLEEFFGLPPAPDYSE